MVTLSRQCCRAPSSAIKLHFSWTYTPFWSILIAKRTVRIMKHPHQETFLSWHVLSWNIPSRNVPSQKFPFTKHTPREHSHHPHLHKQNVPSPNFPSSNIPITKRSNYETCKKSPFTKRTIKNIPISMHPYHNTSPSQDVQWRRYNYPTTMRPSKTLLFYHVSSPVNS